MKTEVIVSLAHDFESQIRCLAVNALDHFRDVTKMVVGTDHFADAGKMITVERMRLLPKTSKKAHRSAPFLSEAASYEMAISSFVPDFTATFQILWRNTQAPHKLLLHASTHTIN